MTKKILLRKRRSPEIGGKKHRVTGLKKVKRTKLPGRIA